MEDQTRIFAPDVPASDLLETHARVAEILSASLSLAGLFTFETVVDVVSHLNFKEAEGIARLRYAVSGNPVEAVEVMAAWASMDEDWAEYAVELLDSYVLPYPAEWAEEVEVQAETVPTQEQIQAAVDAD